MEFKNDLGKATIFQDGDFTVTRSSVWSPPGCHPVCCGVKFYVNEDGVLDHVEGDENNPITRGHLCVRCLALKDYIYNPSRVIYPMKRDRADRGKADKWERISWDEAYTLIEEKTKYFTETYGPESMLVLAGTGRDGGMENQTLAHRVLGTPNAAYCLSGYSCYIPRCGSSSWLLGSPYPEIDSAGGLEGTYSNPDFTLPEVIVLWGKEPMPSNPDGMYGHAVVEMMQQGAKLIVVDPRVNWAATRAAVHVRLRPNTDAAMAMAWLNIIIKEDLYDHNFVEKWTYGFDQLAERVSEMTPEKAAEICGVPVEIIYKAARLYATSKPASICWGLAIDQNWNGVQAGHCILALMAISGNIDVPGGQILADTPNVDTGDSYGDVHQQREETDISTFGWDRLGPELQQKCIGIKEYPAYFEMTLNCQADLLLDTLETGKPYEIKSVVVHSTNLLAPTCSAQPKRWHAALSKLEWSWAIDTFITPTIQACCELILPLSTCAEHDAITFTHQSMSPILIGAMTKAIQVGECKSDQEILFELGKRMRPELWDMHETVHDFINEHRLDNKYTIEEIQAEVYHQKGNTYRKYELGRLRPDGQLGFNTPTGRVELYSTVFAHFGEDPLPYYMEPKYGPVSSPELMEEYPFILTSGARTYSYFHSEHRQIPLLRELNPDPLLEIHPDDAKRLGITDGQWVEIWNQFGEAKLKAKVTPTVYRGLLHAQHGWWFPEEDGNEPNLFGVWRSNINSLVPTKTIGRLGFGAPFKSMICNVKPLDEVYDTDMDLVWEKFGKLVK